MGGTALNENRAKSLIRDLYDMATDADFFSLFTNEFPKKLGSDAIQFFALNDRRAPLFSAATSAYDHVAAQYFPFEAHDPRTQSLARQPGRVLSCVEMAPLSEIERAPVIAEFLDRPHINLRWAMGSAFTLPQGASGLVAALRARARGAFIDAERQPSDIVFPHFMDIARMQFAVSQAKLRYSTLEDALDHDDRAILVVTGDGHIVYANRTAEILLAKGLAILSRNGQIALAGLDADRALRRLIANKAHSRDAIRLTSSFLLLNDDAGNISHVVKASLLPVRSGLVSTSVPYVQLSIEGVFRKITLAPEMRELFGLSRREFEMGEALCSHETIASAAAKLDITLETARGYAKSLLMKLGVPNQKEAVLLMMKFAR